MNVKYAALVSSIICGILTSVLVIKKKLKQSYIDGWFSGFVEASRSLEETDDTGDN